MRKVVVLEQFSFEDVLPPPGWPEEDASGRFAYGGWVGSYSDVVVTNPALPLQAGGRWGFHVRDRALKTRLP